MFRLIFALFGLCTWLFGSVGSIVSLDGEAKIIRDNQEIKAINGIGLEEKDIVSTNAKSIAKIVFNDKTIITLGYNSTINIKDYVFDEKAPKAEFEIATGAFHAITGQIGKINPNRFKLKTKTALIGIRGTEFLGDDSVVICTKGAIFIESNGVKVEVKQGNYSQTTQNQPPTPAKATTEQVLGGFLSKTGISAITSISVLSEQKSGGSGAESSPSQSQNSVNSTPQNAEQSQNSQQNSLSADNANSWGYWAVLANAEATKQAQINAQNEITNAKNTPEPTPNPTLADLIQEKQTGPRGSTIEFSGESTLNGIPVTNTITIIFNTDGNGGLRGKYTLVKNGVTTTDALNIVTINGTNFTAEGARTKISGSFLGNYGSIDGFAGTIETSETLGGTRLTGDLFNNQDVISYVRQIIDAQQNTLLSFSGAVENVTENGAAVTNNASSIRFDVNFGNERASVQNGVLNFKYDGSDITRNFSGGSVSASGIEISNGNDQISGKFIGTSTQIDAIKGTAQTIENAKSIKGDFNAQRQ